MKKSDLLRGLCVAVTSVVLICLPESSFAAGGHGGGGGGFHGGGGGGFHGGGGGGFHGGGGGGFHGGGFGGGFHGGGFGGRGAWGRSGWGGGWGRGGWGWGRGGWGWGRGWGWGYPGWGWGLGVGWGWGSYGGGYPYAYGYPYYYPYDPYSSYGDPNAYAPANPDQYNGANRDPRYNSQRQNSNYPAYGSPGVSSTIPRTTFVSHKPAVDTNSAKYWLTNYQQRAVPRQAVRNVSQALLAMPPEARRRQIESGRYRNFSPAEQKLLNQVAQVSPRVEPQNNVDGTKPSAFRLASQQGQ